MAQNNMCCDMKELVRSRSERRTDVYDWSSGGLYRELRLMMGNMWFYSIRRACREFEHFHHWQFYGIVLLV